jgi:hypothetical protein
MKRTALLILLFLLAPAAFGCAVCVSKPLKIGFQDSELFFIGTVTQRQQWSVTFRVQEQFKGKPVAEVTLRTSNSCSMTRFTVGVSYLVEATPMDDGLHAELCSHTQSVETGNRTVAVVRRRAAWWHSRLSRISLHRFRDLVWRHLG